MIGRCASRVADREPPHTSQWAAGDRKSTLARRYVADHPGVLNCDVDVLRSLIGGWEANFGEAGALIRPAAVAMIEAYLANGRDVVLPQMLINPTELARFEACALDVGAEFVERVFMDTPAACVARFHRRGGSEKEDPWHHQVRAIVAANGGDEALTRYHAALELLLRERSNAVVILSADGAVEDTYCALLKSLN